MDKKTALKLLEKTKQDYEQIAQEFSNTRVHPWPELENLVKQHVKDGDKILDIGCGNGRLCELFKKCRVEYAGIDSSQTLIEKARERFPISNFQFSISDALDFQFKDKEFDVVFCVALLHHIPSEEFRQQVLKNIHRVLKPGGYLLMTNWNLHQPKYLKLQIANCKFKDCFIPWKSHSGKIIQRYYYAFTLRELDGLLRDLGFKILDNCYIKKGVKAHWWNGYNIITVAIEIEK